MFVSVREHQLYRPPSARRERTHLSASTWVFCFSLSFIGCVSPESYFVPTDMRVAYPARPTTNTRVFYEKPPRGCSYKQIGYIEGVSGNGTPDETIALMRQTAAGQGADALILKQHQDPDAHRASRFAHTYAAIAVTFHSHECNAT